MTVDRGIPPAHPAGIKSLDLKGLAGLVETLGAPGYRAGQIARWMYARAARSYAEMTDLPLELRDELERRMPFSFPLVVDVQRSADGTRKYLLELADRVTVEAVGLPTEDRLTVCFSTQAGCAMGCSFCATGASGFIRDLAPGEMADQLSVIAKDFGRRVTNAVAMGQGEPFANYDALLGALRIINSPDGMGIGARHITVSTCGLIPGIKRFASEPEQFTLAVSLHSAVQSTRDRLMPGVRAVPLNRLREAVREYTVATGRRCSFEFALVEGVNDTSEELHALAAYCQGLLVHVNLIPINPVPDAHARRPTEQRVREFAERLEALGVEVTVRAERGSDIDAACGQLKQQRQPR